MLIQGHNADQAITNLILDELDKRGYPPPKKFYNLVSTETKDGTFQNLTYEVFMSKNMESYIINELIGEIPVGNVATFTLNDPIMAISVGYVYFMADKTTNEYVIYRNAVRLRSQESQKNRQKLEFCYGL